jgi:hypothetical protein
MAEGLEEFPFDWIATDLRQGNCIPFLGAGASAFPKNVNAKPPSARALALELARESMYPPSFGVENLMLVASWVEHCMGDRPRLRRTLRKHLADERNPLPCNALHDSLARVAQQMPMAIMTTNYDDLIELALVKRQVLFDLFVVAIDRPGSEGRAQGATLFRPAGQDELKPVTGEQALLDLESGDEEVRLKRMVLFKIHGHVSRARAGSTTPLSSPKRTTFLFLAEWARRTR